MNLNDMISLIQTRLGFRDDIQADIIREVNLAQYELEHDPTFNAPFLWRAKDICICPECVDYALPAGFIRLDEFNNPLFQQNGSYGASELTRAFAIHTYEMNKPAGCIDSFSIYSDNLRLNARGCGVLRLFYYTATTQLTDVVVENLWTKKAFDILMNKAGLNLASILEEEAAFKLFTVNLSYSMDRFKRACVAYEDQGVHAARGDTLYKFPVKNVGGWYEPGSIPCEECV